MNRFNIFALSLLLAGMISGCKGGKTPGITSLETSVDTISYCFGFNIAKNYQKQNNPINPAMLSLGMLDYKAGAAKMNETEIQNFLNVFMSKLQAGKIKREPDGWLVEGSRTELSTEVDSFSYGMGSQIMGSFTKDAIEVNPLTIEQGIWDFKEKKTIIDDQFVTKRLEALSGELQAKKTAEMRIQGEANLVKANEWLAGNKSKEGVKEHSSGLQYKELVAGKGPSPKLEDQVTIHYKGTLLTGEEFDSSISRGEPATFGLNGLIEAWKIALPLMKVGSKWEIYCPPNLAYGEFGSPPKIGPQEALIFEIELIAIPKK